MVPNGVSEQEYFESRLDSQDRYCHESMKNARDYVDTRLQSFDTATKTAYASMERRLESMNEFRAQLKEQSQNFITRQEYSDLIRQVQALSERRSDYVARAEHDALIKDIVEIRQVRASFITRGEHETLCNQVNSIAQGQAVMEGKASQGAVYVAYAISAASIILAIILHFIH